MEGSTIFTLNNRKCWFSSSISRLDRIGILNLRVEISTMRHPRFLETFVIEIRGREIKTMIEKKKIMEDRVL